MMLCLYGHLNLLTGLDLGLEVTNGVRAFVVVVVVVVVGGGGC